MVERGEQEPRGRSVTVYDLLLGSELDLNNLSGLLRRRFKLPLAHRIGGRVDQQRASSHHTTPGQKSVADGI